MYITLSFTFTICDLFFFFWKILYNFTYLIVKWARWPDQLLHSFTRKTTSNSLRKYFTNRRGRYSNSYFYHRRNYAYYVFITKELISFLFNSTKMLFVGLYPDTKLRIIVLRV